MKNYYLNIYIEYWAAAFDFKGRSTRDEYFTPFIINWLIGFIITYITNIGHPTFEPTVPTLYATAIWSTLTIIPHSAVTIRRLHDTGRNFKWAVPNILFYSLALYSDMSKITGEIDTNTSEIKNIGFFELSISVLIYLPIIIYIIKLVSILFEDSDDDNQWGPAK